MNSNVVVVRAEGGRGTRTSAVPRASVRRWALRMMASLELDGAELSVVLCDDAFIHDLNRRFADEDHATDVLSFASREAPGPRDPRLLGDVIISIETAARQAAAREAPLDDEVRVLLAHGLLHLLGYDHRYAAERRIMTTRTTALVDVAMVVAVPARARGR